MRRIFGKFYTILHFFIENWKIGLDFSRKGGKSLASESHDERGLARDGGVGHGKIVGQLSLGEVKLLIFSRNVFLVLEDGLDVVEGGVVLDVEGDVLDYLHANFLLHASLLLRLRLLLHLLPPGNWNRDDVVLGVRGDGDAVIVDVLVLFVTLLLLVHCRRDDDGSAATARYGQGMTTTSKTRGDQAGAGEGDF